MSSACARSSDRASGLSGSASSISMALISAAYPLESHNRSPAPEFARLSAYAIAKLTLLQSGGRFVSLTRSEPRRPSWPVDNHVPSVRGHRYVDRVEGARPGDQIERLEAVEHRLERLGLGAAHVIASDLEC